MVFLTRLLGHLWKDHTNPFTGYMQQSPDKFWIRRRVRMMTAHYCGRKRNCYTIASKYLIRALTYSTINRKVKKRDFRELCDQRKLSVRLNIDTSLKV
jgi:ribosomal protein L20